MTTTMKPPTRRFTSNKNFIPPPQKFMGPLLLSLSIFCLIGCASAVKVSFYGASHIAMPLQEAKISTNIRLRFRTAQRDSLIFLAAGRTDYALVNLEQGRVKFLFKISDHNVEMRSPVGIKALNDLEWHDISIQRYDKNITLQVDEHFVRHTLPEGVAELNVHFGVFLGGVGDFSGAYLDKVASFRGCMSDVYYNNINVLKRAKERTSHVTSVGVSWTCAPEFDADVHQSISFIEKEAYMVYAKQPSQLGESWSFEFRTIETEGGLLYNMGTGSRSDFICLEILGGQLRLLVGKGSNVVELIPEKDVSDGIWHNVSLTYSPVNIELKVDDVGNSAVFAIGSSQHLELNEDFYIGGLDSRLSKRASIKGSQVSEISLKGCMKNIFINTNQLGFPHMRVTLGLTVDCVWRYPCIERPPCIMSGICQQFGIDEFICHCNQAYCIRGDYMDRYKIFSRLDLPQEVEILSVSPMPILEGSSDFISPMFVDVLFDYTKLGLIEAGVLFHVVQAPKYGNISVLQHSNGRGNETQSKFFSLIDLSTNKVKYTHTGREHFHDSITMDLQLVSPSSRDTIPKYLQGKHRFVLHVNITPVNDAPMLMIPTNRILRLTQGIPKILNPDLFHAVDPDSPENSLMYTISTPANIPISGRLEVSGKSVSTFSQSEINDGLVTYVVDNQGGSQDDTAFELGVQVSDGKETSPPVMLKVSVLPLQLRMINNTGLMLIHKSSALITPTNLSFIANSEDEQIDVKYTIVQRPQFGSIQRQRVVDASWVNVDSFTSNQLFLGEIRFLHLADFPSHDEFKFTVSLGPVETLKYDFRITFTKLSIGIKTQKNVVIEDGSEEVTITNELLFHQTTPVATLPRNIIYEVVRPPKYGIIYVEGYPEYAKEKDSFTQQDVDRNLIRFKTYYKSYSSFVDTFEFRVYAPECEEVTGVITIVNHPTDAVSSSLTYQVKERVLVNEGRAALITPNHFEVNFDSFKVLLTFNISQQPRHGAICNYDEKKSQVNIIQWFTYDDLLNGTVYYCHDDTETSVDAFTVLILGDPLTDFQFVTEVQVQIQLKNDNEPYNYQSKVFHVVENEGKVITGEDLLYLDNDLNTTADRILYMNIEIPNGEIVKGGVPVSRFTQEEVNNRSLMFRHRGAVYGKVFFTVSDGEYDVPGFLEVQASEPFLKVRYSNASVVQEGRYIHVNEDDLSIDTNLNAEPHDIEYTILEGPNYGVLRLQNVFNPDTSSFVIPKSSSNSSTRVFTQLDINKQRLIYWNTEVASMDKIRYRVSTAGIWTEGELMIRIYPAAYWEVLQIRRNQTLYVEESTNVVISRDVLEIVHPKISPGDITYLVTTSPQHGYLEIQSLTLDDEYNTKVFDQSTINAEKMFYIQAGVNQSSDHFVFDVTNGITWLRDLMLKIVIIPENIFIQARTIHVVEGANVTIKPTDMLPFSEYYIGKILEYKIIQPSQFGSIKSGKSSKVNRFTQKQLDAGIIQYVHNGSENSSDIIKLVAIARNKESVPFDFNISVIPVNDELPAIVTNTGLQTWVGGRSPIRKSDLMAQDKDTSPDDLVFIVNRIEGGHLVIADGVEGKDRRVKEFTQRDIDEDRVIFVHNHTFYNGRMDFYVSDGVHQTGKQTLMIEINPVSLMEVHNENLHVFPLTRKTIQSELLQYKCSDEGRKVRYVITVPPQMGRILYEHTPDTLSDVTEFTQHDLDSGKILYEHTHAMVELKSNDSFYFDVISMHANSLINQMFYIDISVSSGGLLRFLPVPQIVLNEGDRAAIRLNLSKVLEYLETRAGIQSPELYIEAFNPMHGRIELKDFKNNVSRLTLNDFNQNRIFYKHDHSDTVEDKLEMSVYLLQGQIFLCNLTIPVKINPINDQPFELVTKSPGISVVEGENRTITRENLLAQDLDTDPKDLIFDIISGPTVGKLVKIPDDSGIAQDIMTYGNQFTQQDIDEGRIVFIHTGVAQSTTFYFSVSDGKFNPALEIFNITILPMTISAGLPNDPILVPQGESSAKIGSRHLNIETNVHKERLMYNITSTPSNGMILRNEKPVLRFSQMQLMDHEITYVQSDSTQSNDTFQVTAYISDTNYGSVINAKVLVHPSITINPITVISGEKIRLGTTASQFANSNMNFARYNPKITILNRPKYGRVKKITRNSGENLESTKDKDIGTFTLKELKSGVIYYVAKKLPPDVNILQDTFEYILSIKSVQPAQGTASITVQSRDYDDGIMLADSALPINYILIAAIIGIIFILALTMFMIIRCWMRRKAHKKEKERNKHGVYPPSLPRPPDFIMDTGNRMNSTSDLDSIPMTGTSTPLPGMSNVPQCKVIPVMGFDTDYQDSESEMAECLNNNGHVDGYPYGSVEPEDWSLTYEMNDVNYASIPQNAQPQHQQHQQMNGSQHTLGSRTNPLLRRNQYWV